MNKNNLLEISVYVSSAIFLFSIFLLEIWLKDKRPIDKPMWLRIIACVSLVISFLTCMAFLIGDVLGLIVSLLRS